MTITGNTRQLEVGDWILQVHQPDGQLPNPEVYLLLHGWTGDEKVMWVFANRLPDQYLMVAPRGPYPTPLGGFGWQAKLTERWTNYENLRPTANSLLELVDALAAVGEMQKADFSSVHLMGFSQGAALAYTFALSYPKRVRSLVGLAGFMPTEVAEIVASRPLQGIPAFVSHGIQDDTVPVARARQSVELLERAGAQVTYCEDDVGHKLGSNCFRAMRDFVDKL